MYFGTPPIIRNGLITYWDAANYLSFTGSLSGSNIVSITTVTFISSSSIGYTISGSISESYSTTTSSSIVGYITSSTIIGYTTSSNIVGYTTSSSGTTTTIVGYTTSSTITGYTTSSTTVGYTTSSTTVGYTTEVTSYNVTNNGSGAYVFNGTGSNPSISLIRGTTYTFNLNASGHPFWIKTNQSTGTGDSYDEGVSNNGTQIGTISWIVSSSAPSTLYYNCQHHSAMVGTFNISDGPFVGQPITSESYSPIISESYSPVISESYSPIFSSSISESYTPIISESYSPIVSQSFEPDISSSIIIITSSFASSSVIEFTASFLIPSSSISSSIMPTTASWIDVSGNGNTGVFINNPTFIREGGGAFSFDGASNTVLVPQVSSSYTFTDNVTVSCWTKVNSFTLTKAFASKFTGSISGSGFEFLVRPGNKVYFEGRNKNASVGLFSVSSSQALSTNTWYNVVGVKAGTSVKLYVNGQFSNEITISASGDISNTQPFSLANESTGGFFYGGTIANLLLYNRVLSDGEILKNYEALRTRYQ